MTRTGSGHNLTLTGATECDRERASDPVLPINDLAR